MNLYIHDEGLFGGFSILAKDADEAMNIIIANEDFDVEDIEAYKKELLPRLKRLPVAYGTVYRFRGDS